MLGGEDVTGWAEVRRGVFCTGCSRAGRRAGRHGEAKALLPALKRVLWVDEACAVTLWRAGAVALWGMIDRHQDRRRVIVHMLAQSR
jgi:hypothetical protein